ncbi:MAG TPA: hypothetical protein VN607_12275 [Gemmatimonadaceae bacterium]|nr:hypothetical protein [Gemmatimonadaceae bacterium]
MGASAAAAVILHKEKVAIAAFRSAGAVSPERAASLEAIGAGEGLAFHRLRERAVLREAGQGTGRYYLDEPTWAAVRRTRARLVAVALAIAVVIILGVVFGAFASRAS